MPQGGRKRPATSRLPVCRCGRSEVREWPAEATQSAATPAARNGYVPGSPGLTSSHDRSDGGSQHRRLHARPHSSRSGLSARSGAARCERLPFLGGLQAHFIQAVNRCVLRRRARLPSPMGHGHVVRRVSMVHRRRRRWRLGGLRRPLLFRRGWRRGVGPRCW